MIATHIDWEGDAMLVRDQLIDSGWEPTIGQFKFNNKEEEGDAYTTENAAIPAPRAEGPGGSTPLPVTLAQIHLNPSHPRTF